MDNNMDKYIGKLFDGRYEILERIGSEAWRLFTKRSTTG
jgi:hypothetical protein